MRLRFQGVLALLFAFCATFFAAEASAYAGAEPVRPDGQLTLSIDWYEGFTGHSDDGTVGGASAPRAPAGLNLGAGALVAVGALAVGYTLLTGDVGGAFFGAALASGVVPATTGEVKQLLDELQRDFENEFKAYTERAEAEQKQHGDALSETKSTLDRINKRQDEIETMLQRVGTGSGGAEAAGPEAKARAEAFLAYVKGGRAEMTPEQRKALVLDSDGEILVPEDFETELYRELPRPVNIRGLAAHQTTSSNRVRRATLGELTVAWGKLETSLTPVSDSMPGTPGEGYIYVEDLYGLAKIGEDELMDSAFNLEAYVRDSFRDAIEVAEDAAFVSGTGHTNEQPGGIIPEVSAVGPNTYVIETAVKSTLDTDDMLDLKYALPEQYQSGAGYIIRFGTQGTLRKLRASANGQYLWQPSLAAGAPPTFDGQPVYTNAGVPAIADGQVVAIYGNVRYGYKVVDRLGMTIKRLNELYAESGLVGFRVHFRVGGGVVRPEAFRLLKVKAT